MGSIVTKDVASYEIWAGNPARKIKSRFSDQVIKELEQSRWWDLPDQTMDVLSRDIVSPDRFIKRAKVLEE